VQRLKLQLDQYTDKTPEQDATIEALLPQAVQRGFKGEYLQVAQRLKNQREAKGEDGKLIHDVPTAEQPDFEFALFNSTLIDYDYIMKLMENFSSGGASTVSRDSLIELVQSDAKFINEQADIAAYIHTLQAGAGLTMAAIESGYSAFKQAKTKADIANIAASHHVKTEALQQFVELTLQRLILDGDSLTDLMSDLGLGWLARGKAEMALMQDLIPLLKKGAGERDISGLRVYEI
jgi:type I restriction enzyme R subunit